MDIDKINELFNEAAVEKEINDVLALLEGKEPINNNTIDNVNKVKPLLDNEAEDRKNQDSENAEKNAETAAAAESRRQEELELKKNLNSDATEDAVEKAEDNNLETLETATTIQTDDVPTAETSGLNDVEAQAEVEALVSDDNNTNQIENIITDEVEIMNNINESLDRILAFLKEEKEQDSVKDEGIVGIDTEVDEPIDAKTPGETVEDKTSGSEEMDVQEVPSTEEPKDGTEDPANEISEDNGALDESAEAVEDTEEDKKDEDEVPGENGDEVVIPDVTGDGVPDVVDPDGSIAEEAPEAEVALPEAPIEEAPVATEPVVEEPVVAEEVTAEPVEEEKPDIEVNVTRDGDVHVSIDESEDLTTGNDTPDEHDTIADVTEPEGLASELKDHVEGEEVPSTEEPKDGTEDPANEISEKNGALDESADEATPEITNDDMFNAETEPVAAEDINTEEANDIQTENNDDDGKVDTDTIDDAEDIDNETAADILKESGLPVNTNNICVCKKLVSAFKATTSELFNSKVGTDIDTEDANEISEEDGALKESVELTKEQEAKVVVHLVSGTEIEVPSIVFGDVNPGHKQSDDIVKEVITEDQEYNSISDLVKLDESYFAAPSFKVIDLESKKARIQEQIENTLAKEAGDVLYEELEKAVKNATLLEKQIHLRYGKIAKERTDNLFTEKANFFLSKISDPAISNLNEAAGEKKKGNAKKVLKTAAIIAGTTILGGLAGAGVGAGAGAITGQQVEMNKLAKQGTEGAEAALKQGNDAEVNVIKNDDGTATIQTKSFSGEQIGNTKDGMVSTYGVQLNNPSDTINKIDAATEKGAKIGTAVGGSVGGTIGAVVGATKADVIGNKKKQIKSNPKPSTEDELTKSKIKELIANSEYNEASKLATTPALKRYLQTAIKGEKSGIGK